MSATTKPKGKTHFRYGWKLSPKAKALRFQPRSIVGARKILSRVEMNAQLRAPLTAFSAPMPPSVLTTAIVVIHGMTRGLSLVVLEFLSHISAIAAPGKNLYCCDC